MSASQMTKRGNADLFANILGVLFVICAIAELVREAASEPAGVFAPNFAQIFVHLATGCILLVAAHLGGATGAIRGLGLVYALLVVAGLALPRAVLDDLALTVAGVGLNALFAAALLLVGLVAGNEEPDAFETVKPARRP